MKKHSLGNQDTVQQWRTEGQNNTVDTELLTSDRQFVCDMRHVLLQKGAIYKSVMSNKIVKWYGYIVFYSVPMKYTPFWKQVGLEIVTSR